MHANNLAHILCCTITALRLPPMKTNITVKVDADLAREAKVLAARRGTSVSQLVANELEELVRRDKSYQLAMQRALSRLNKGYDLDWQKPSDRDELYER